MPSLRVLHAIGTADIGGTERFLADLMARHRAAGLDPVVCVMDEPGPMSDAYAASAGAVHYLQLNRSILGGIARWRRLLADVRPSVIVLYGTRANMLGRMVRTGVRAPLINALRSTVLDDRGSRISPVLDRLTFRRLACCVSNSASALDALLACGYPADRLAFVPPGINLERFSGGDRAHARSAFGVAPDDVVLLCVANLKPVKNHELLLRASAALSAEGYRHRLWLVGDGPERAGLQERARAHPDPGSILFAGHEADPAPRYRAADLVVLASNWEGSPTVALEALASGVPVVATAVGDVRAVVEDGVTGSLVPPGNPDALVSALKEGFDPARRSTWAANARQHGSRFSADSASDSYRAIFEWAAGRRPGPPPCAYRASGRPLRILRVLSRLNVGGPAIHVSLLTRLMQGADETTTLVTGSVGKGEGDMNYFATQQGVEPYRIPALGRSVHPLRDVAAFLDLVRLTFKFRPDIVHTHASKGGALGRLAAILYNLTRRRSKRAAILHTYHGHTFEGYFGPLVSRVFRTIEWLLGRWTDGIVVLSPRQFADVAERFRIAPAARTHIVPLGLALQQFFASDDIARGAAREALGVGPGEALIVAVGRLTAIKDHAMLLEAFAALVTRAPHVRLMLAGDGELRQELETRAQELGVQQHVRFLGWQRDLAPLYAAADVVALSSRNEGTPVALIEAIAAGCPVVATRVGGVPDVVDDASGILVAPGDAQAFAEALASGIRLGRLPQPTRQRMRQFSIERLVSDLRLLYRQLLARTRARTESPAL